VSTRGATKANHMVHGRCHYAKNPGHGVDFDATAWFDQATDDKVKALFDIGCANDFEADAVARFVAKTDVEVRQFLDGCKPGKGRDDPIPFDVVINRLDAATWVRNNRPELAEQLRKAGLMTMGLGQE
jgi:hypothetical protein